MMTGVQNQLNSKKCLQTMCHRCGHYYTSDPQKMCLFSIQIPKFFYENNGKLACDIEWKIFLFIHSPHKIKAPPIKTNIISEPIQPFLYISTNKVLWMINVWCRVKNITCFFSEKNSEFSTISCLLANLQCKSI